MQPAYDDHAMVPAQYEPPNNLELEAVLLGACLRNGDAFHRVFDRVEADHFYAAEHQRIWSGMLALNAQGKDVNPTMLAAWADKEGYINAIGGAAYLRELMANIVTVVSVQGYADNLIDLWKRRACIDAAEVAVTDWRDPALGLDTAEPDRTTDGVAEHLEGMLAEIVDTGSVDNTLVDLSVASDSALTAIEAAHKSDGAVVGLATGITELDALIGGLIAGKMYIVAGRPSMGKSALAFGWAFDIARNLDDGRILIVSAEMSAEDIVKRELARMTGIPVQRQNRGDVNNDEFERLALAQSDLKRLPVSIDDGSGPPVARIRARAGRLDRKSRHSGGSGVRLVIVDYIGLLRDPVWNGNRVQEVGAISRGLKNLSKDLGCPVVALAQLNRGLESREDKRPQLSDLRESGDIEQDADVVLFVYRDEYYLARTEPKQRTNEGADKFDDRHARWRQTLNDSTNIAELIVAKQRDGAVGSVETFFSGARMSFQNLDRGVE